MLNKQNLIIILDKLFDQSKKYYDDFNSADAKIGDGDLGITILHGLEEIQKNQVYLQLFYHLDLFYLSLKLS